MPETETAEPETTEDVQQFAEGFEPITIKPIETIAKKYRKKMRERLELLEEEVVLKEKLRAIMKEHSDELPTRINKQGYKEMFYPLGDGTQAVVSPTDEDVKVKKMPKEPKQEIDDDSE